LNESSDISTSKWNVLDATADYITISHWDYVRYTVSTINHGTSQRALLYIFLKNVREKNK
jgi:hypothetical protein